MSIKADSFAIANEKGLQPHLGLWPTQESAMQIARVLAGGTTDTMKARGWRAVPVTIEERAA